MIRVKQLPGWSTRKEDLLGLYGVRAQKQGKDYYFVIDPGFAEMEEVRELIHGLIAEDDYVELFEKQMDASDFLTEIEKKLDFSKFHDSYKITGDVCKVLERGERTILELSSFENGSYRLRCIASTASVSYSGLAENKKVQVMGHPVLYSARGQLEFEVTKIQVLDEKTEYQKALDRYQDEIDDYVMEHDEKTPVSLKKTIGIWQKLVLLAPDYQSIQDFLALMGKKVGFEVEPHVIHMVPENLVQNIRDYNRPDVDAIAIIHPPGWDMYQLMPFYAPSVYEAVNESLKPILLGLGYGNDHPFCEKCADYSPSTASMLAVKLAYLWADAYARTYTHTDRQTNIHNEPNVQEEDHAFHLSSLIRKFLPW